MIQGLKAQQWQLYDMANIWQQSYQRLTSPVPLNTELSWSCRKYTTFSATNNNSLLLLAYYTMSTQR